MRVLTDGVKTPKEVWTKIFFSLSELVFAALLTFISYWSKGVSAALLYRNLTNFAGYVSL